MSRRRVLVTVTGFTIAHSITLALAALNLVRVPVPPVEAAIALPIIFLATEIARDRRDTLTWRYPIAVAGSFGLLQALSEQIGLSRGVALRSLRQCIIPSVISTLRPR